MTMDTRVHTSLAQLLKLRYQARGFSLQPQQPVSSVLSGRKRSKLRGRGLDFIELRHYHLGDDIRTMDWRVSNRTGKPHVRVYAEEKDRSVYLLVDQRSSLFFGSQYKMKSVIAAELAALAAWRILRAGDRVGALLFNDDRLEQFPPSRSEQNLIQCFSQLIKMNNALSATTHAQPTSITLKEALQKTERYTSHDSLIIVISDFNDWDEQCLKSFKRLAQHNDVVAALISDPLEQDPAVADKLVVSDGTHQFEIDSSNTALMENYRNCVSKNFEDIRLNLIRHNIPVIAMNTREDVLRQVQSALGGQR